MCNKHILSVVYLLIHDAGDIRENPSSRSYSKLKYVILFERLTEFFHVVMVGLFVL